MKNKVINRFINIFILTVLLINLFPINIVEAITDANLLISVGIGKYAINVTKSTTIDDIIKVLGEPKIKTKSAFGGYAYTFYTDSNYSNYLYIETDQDEGIISFGSVDPTYKTRTYSYGDDYNYRENGVLHGCLYNSNGKIIAGIYYNREKWNEVGFNGISARYENNYKSDENTYLYSLSKHAVTMFNAIRAVKGINYKADFNDDCFYINQQLKEYDTSIKAMLEKTGKSKEYKGIKLKEKVGFTNSIYYILNPLVIASLESYAISDFGDKNIAIFDYNMNTKMITTGMIAKDALNLTNEVPYTNEEREKLENGRKLYKSAIEKLYKEEGLFKVEPQTTNPSALVAGELKDSKKQGIVDYLNMVRAGEGLSMLKLNEDAFKVSQHIATLISYRKTELGLDIAHIPPKPAGVSDEYYKIAVGWGKGYAENLGYSQTKMSEEMMMYHINMFLDDGSERPQNFSHRTKMLDTEFTDFGYGISNLTFANEFTGYKASDVIAQTWPADGITFMESLIDNKFKWSTQFVKRYKVQENSTVEVRCVNNGKTWRWDGEENSSTRFFTTYTKSISSINNKVVFYDSSISPAAGEVYEITVKNVLDENTNKLVEYKYRTRFEYADTSKTEKRISSLNIETPEKLEKIDNKTYLAQLGQTTKLNAKIGTTGTNEYIKMTWSSSDKSKVEVTQNGIITIKDVTTNPITIEVSEEFSGLKDSIQIVTSSKGISLSLDKKEAQLNKVGETLKLNAKLSNGSLANATWTSSNPKIATVDSNGIVTAKNGGFVYITAKNSFGTGKCWIYVCLLRTLPDGSKVYPGDLDGNGAINSNDAAMASDWGNSNLTEDQIAVADINCDGVVNGTDNAFISDIANGSTSFIPGKYNPVTNVTLNKTTLILAKVGNSETLTATYSPLDTTDSPNVRWYSDNTKVATVTNGKVTAVGTGTATIRATVGKKSTTCMVTVPQQAIPLVGISLNKTVLKLEKGKTETLTVSYNPSNTTENKAVTWKTSNQQVATVVNGKITAVGEGTARITATVNGKSAICTVTVSQPIIPLTGISLSKTVVTLEKGKTETLTVSYNPTNTTENKAVTWKTSNQQVATIVNGKITAIGSGTAIITATVGSKSASCKVTVPTQKPVVDYLLGDVDGNGKIEAQDAVMILKYVAHNIELTPKQLLAANTTKDKDGTVNASDAVQILKYVAHNITEF